jgi:hypothetical protein
MNIKKVVLSVAIAGILFSCDNNEPDLPKGDFDSGFLVTNEGAFSGGTGTVNFISDDFTVEDEKIYNKVNNESIGTVLQSAGFYNDDIYLVANVGNKISVANRYSMEKITEITKDLSNPRYIAFTNNKGYVTNWGDGADTEDDYIAVINLETNTVESKISVIEGPEQIIANGNTLYVSHKGGWGSGNSVTAINAINNSVITNIKVGDIPDELAIDNNGNLLVSCEGKALTSWNPTEVLGSLVKINTATNEVLSTINFESGFHPNIMTFSDATIYISTSSAIYEMPQNATEIPTASIIDTTVSGLAVKNNRIYVTDVKDFVKSGSLTVFDRSTKSVIKEFTVGLIPSKIYFN